MNDPVSTPDVDCAQRFMFEDYGIRGEIVRLGSSLETILGQHFYPAPVAGLLGEMLTASALLSYTLKFDGSLSLQARSDGVVGLLEKCEGLNRLRSAHVVKYPTQVFWTKISFNCRLTPPSFPMHHDLKTLIKNHRFQEFSPSGVCSFFCKGAGV